MKLQKDRTTDCQWVPKGSFGPRGSDKHMEDCNTKIHEALVYLFTKGVKSTSNEDYKILYKHFEIVRKALINANYKIP